MHVGRYELGKIRGRNSCGLLAWRFLSYIAQSLHEAGAIIKEGAVEQTKREQQILDGSHGQTKIQSIRYY